MTEAPRRPQLLAAGVAQPAQSRSAFSTRLLALPRQWPDDHPRGFLIFAALLFALFYSALVPA